MEAVIATRPIAEELFMLEKRYWTAINRSLH